MTWMNARYLPITLHLFHCDIESASKVHASKSNCVSCLVLAAGACGRGHRGSLGSAPHLGGFQCFVWRGDLSRRTLAFDAKADAGSAADAGHSQSPTSAARHVSQRPVVVSLHFPRQRIPRDLGTRFALHAAVSIDGRDLRPRSTAAAAHSATLSPELGLPRGPFEGCAG